MDIDPGREYIVQPRRRRDDAYRTQPVGPRDVSVASATANDQREAKVTRPFDALILDMDGTLIESTLEFDTIRAALGIEPGAGTLEAIERMDPARREGAMARLLEFELASVRAARLHDGAGELIADARRAGIATALLTRNAAEAMALVLARFPQLEFDVAWSREQGPIKPEPDGIVRACQRMGVEPARSVCVGDFRYDLVAANAAGAVSVRYAPRGAPDCADLADRVVSCFDDLRAILEI